MEWKLSAGILEVWELKKSTCPKCKSNNIAWIFWGYPADTDWYLKGIESKEIVPGGCIVTDHDPKWECNDCHHQYGERDDD